MGSRLSQKKNLKSEQQDWDSETIFSAEVNEMKWGIGLEDSLKEHVL